MINEHDRDEFDDDYNADNPAHLAAALQRVADGEGDVPPVIGTLPAEDQAVLLRGAHDLADTVRARIAEI